MPAYQQCESRCGGQLSVGFSPSSDEVAWHTPDRMCILYR